MLAGFEQLFGDRVMNRGCGEVDHNFNGCIRQDFLHAERFDPVFLSLCLGFLRVQVAATHHLKNLKLVDHRGQIGVADHAAANNGNFHRFQLHDFSPYLRG